MAHILIVDDEAEQCLFVSTLLKGAGHEPKAVHSGEEAIQHVRTAGDPELILLDLRLRGIDGLETLRCLRTAGCTAPIVVVTACGNVQLAVRAIKLGATDFVLKPLDPRRFLENVARIALPRADVTLGAVLVGTSGSHRHALERARRFASQDINVLLLGETGTGKEVFARTIHGASRRAAGPFVPVDCSTLADTLIESELFGHEKGSFTGAVSSRIGRFELAQGGTLFLDEIGNLPVSTQAKLLRVLQTRQLERVGGRESIRLDVRVVAATNVDLEQAIAQGRFRQDLYFRLQEIVIHLPPLRERADDVRALAEYFVSLYAQRFGVPVSGIAEDALEILARYEWPGNVRQLENAMKSAVVLAADQVTASDLPESILGRSPRPVLAQSRPLEEDGRFRVELEFGLKGPELDLKALGAQAAEQAERSLLQELIRRGSGSSARLAKRLSVDPKTLRLKLRRYGLDATLDGRRAAGLPAPPLRRDDLVPH